MGLGFRSVTLTLTNTGQAQNLLTLIAAVTGYANAQDGCHYISLRGDDSLSGGQYIYVGDANVSSSSYATRLGQADWYPIAPGFRFGISLSDVYILPSAGGIELDVAWSES
jgi:hypothetical protein